MANEEVTVLKSDLLSKVELVILPQDTNHSMVVRRDTRCVPWWTRPVAHYLASREARFLVAANGMEGLPRLVSWQGGVLVRSWLEGAPLQKVRPRDCEYFRQAFFLLRKLHRAGLVHNDLAKEPNWLVQKDHRAALIDFQLAWAPLKRTRFFRMLAREDLRHMLKHKRTYCPESLTAREKRILASPSLLARLWMTSGKKVYLFVTRKLLGWADREGAGDRNT
jgi:RIO-like serine/threonine protein kinase